MSDLISREEAVRDLGDAHFKNYGNAIMVIQSLPSAEPKHGKWDIEISDDGYQATYHCSECGHRFKWIYDPHFPPVFNYCQKCGARMDG